MTSTASAPPSPPVAADAPLRRKLVWIGLLYFASGFPFGVFYELLPTYFRVAGVGLAAIGFVQTLQLSWTLKFLWAPLVDRVGTRKGWMLVLQLGLAATLAGLALVDVATVSTTVWILLGLLTVLSATQDIAIDAYSIELLSKREYGAANGIRVTAYRVALIAAGGLFVALGGRIGWTWVFALAAVVMLVVAAITLTLPSPALERERGVGVTGELRAAVWAPLRAFLGRPWSWALLLFVLTFKIGDFTLMPMTRPFWVDAGFSAEQIGLVVGTFGMLATIAGALLGGALTTRWGTFTALWVLGLAQALSNLGYWAAATVAEPTLAVFYAASLVEQFTQGLGTAAFLAFLMALCEKRFAATQYALLSAVFGLSRTIAANRSGVLAESLGYAEYFLLTLAIAFPAFLLLPLVKRAIEE